MKMTIDLPEELIADAMRFTGAETTGEAVVKAVEVFNRGKKVDEVLKLFGAFPDFPTNDEIEAADVADVERMSREWSEN